MNGDAEGNYTLLARLPFNYSSDVVNATFENSTNRYGLFPVGIFSLKSNDTQLPVSEIFFVNDKMLNSFKKYVFALKAFSVSVIY